ncbi:metal-dependent hydrolase [Peptostreptococcus faecalis]|uniref:metal-dependent hydrolase n=1 Tax=Peptostreptococcus faecalis TaxID=2045015 RepID=UPI000C79AFC3|nr:metal-dependent hydrolase [Peptostreptococcus faecalis]
MRGKSHLIIGTLSAVELSVLAGFTITPLGIISAAFFSVAADIDEANSNSLNKLISKKFTNKIHKIIIYSLLILSFYLYISSYKNIFLGVFLAIALIFIIEKKLTSNLIRSILISFIFFVFASILSLYEINTGLTIMVLILAFFPLMKHRSLTHSLLMLAIIYTVFTIVENTSNISSVAFITTASYATHLLCDMVTKRGIPLFYPFSKKNYRVSQFKVGSFFCNAIEYSTILVVAFLLICTISFLGVKIKLY